MSSPDSNTKALISVWEKCWLKLSLKIERLHMAGAALAVEVKNSIIPGIWWLLEEKAVKEEKE